MNVPSEVVEAVKNNKCIILLGSRFAGEAAEMAGKPYPEAKDLAKSLGWKKPKAVMGQKAKAVIPSVEEGAAGYAAANGRAALVKLLQAEIGCDGVAPTEAHRGALRRFPILLTTCCDDLLERAAAEMGVTLDVIDRGQKIPDPDPARRTLLKLKGSLSRPETLVLTADDYKARAFSPEVRKQLRSLIRSYVVLFVGFRPDEEEFEHLFVELSDAYGGELPRCHLAVAQGPIDDYLWQKWVWRGLLMFTADPTETLKALESQIP